jgi:hypothetical protein
MSYKVAVAYCTTNSLVLPTPDQALAVAKFKTDNGVQHGAYWVQPTEPKGCTVVESFRTTGTDCGSFTPMLHFRPCHAKAHFVCVPQ